MTKLGKLRTCDRMLILLTLLVLASGIQLEATDSSYAGWVWVHVVVGSIFCIIIAWHLYLHFQWQNWIKRLANQKSPVTRWLSIFYALIVITAIVATIHWLVTISHSPIGGIHGKIGFIFIVLCIGHLVKRIKSPVLVKK